LTGTLVEALDRFGETSVLHDNGIWRSHHHQLATLASRRGIPRVVSTRGMLEPWAMNHKRFKKRLAWWLYQQRDLKRADCHHATAEQEARSVERLALGVEIRVIPNGIDLPPPRQPTETGRRTALFLGRIYPVKGLPMLVEAWARVRPRGWILKIAGPDEAGHRAAVEQAVAAADLQNTITFVGPVDGPSKHSSLDGAALFILPTHSESFGIAVAEALAHGLPVLTTTAAPWPALSEQGCGWRVAPTVDGLAAGLREATSVDRSTLEAMGARGRAFVAAKLAWDRIAEQYVAMYEELLGARC
jgi:glycosyltransferase involved in cell wall biosynthesis